MSVRRFVMILRHLVGLIFWVGLLTPLSLRASHRTSQLQLQTEASFERSTNYQKCIRALRIFGTKRAPNLSSEESAQLFTAWDLAERAYGSKSPEAQDLFDLYEAVTNPRDHQRADRIFVLKTAYSYGDEAATDQLNEWIDLIRKKTSWEMKAVLTTAGITALGSAPLIDAQRLLGDPLVSLAASVGLVGSIYVASKALENKSVNSNNRFIYQAQRLLADDQSRNMSHFQWKVSVAKAALLDDMRSRMSSTEHYLLSRWIWEDPADLVDVVFDHNMARNHNGTIQFLSTARVMRASQENP